MAMVDASRVRCVPASDHLRLSPTRFAAYPFPFCLLPHVIYVCITPLPLVCLPQQLERDGPVHRRQGRVRPALPLRAHAPHPHPLPHDRYTTPTKHKDMGDRDIGSLSIACAWLVKTALGSANGRSLAPTFKPYGTPSLPLLPPPLSLPSCAVPGMDPSPRVFGLTWLAFLLISQASTAIGLFVASFSPNPLVGLSLSTCTQIILSLWIEIIVRCVCMV